MKTMMIIFVVLAFASPCFGADFFIRPHDSQLFDHLQVFPDGSITGTGPDGRVWSGYIEPPGDVYIYRHEFKPFDPKTFNPYVGGYDPKNPGWVK